MACLDTTMLVDLNRADVAYGRRAAQKVVELTDRGQALATTRFNAAEMYLGVQLATERHRDRELERGAIFWHASKSSPSTIARAWLFAGMTAHLRRIGRPAGDMDVLIAATALAAGHCLVTRNPAHFADIPGVVVEAY